MERQDIEKLRERVSCASVLTQRGWKVDVRESTRRALKFRRGSGEIVIVIHGGRGWFDPQSDEKGDVFGLARRLGATGFVDALRAVGELAGAVPAAPAWRKPMRRSSADLNIAQRWAMRGRPSSSSVTWTYLTVQRHLPEAIVRQAIREDRLREGPQGSVWAAHLDAAGRVTGWEARGPRWRGFAAGGAKTLFRLGSKAPYRVCVTEAAIDALSLAAIEGSREGSLYVSTGGGWSSATEVAIRELASRSSLQLVAATDNNPQGERFAARLREIAETSDCDWLRLRPRADDWNETLAGPLRPKRRREDETGLPHARRRRQG